MTISVKFILCDLLKFLRGLTSFKTKDVDPCYVPNFKSFFLFVFCFQNFYKHFTLLFTTHNQIFNRVIGEPEKIKTFSLPK